MKAIATAYLFCLGCLLAYEVQIADSPKIDTLPPRIDTLPDSRVFAVATDGKTSLLDFLGGEEKIKKIVIGIVANKKHGDLNESVVRTRFAEAVCIDSSKHGWSYSPFAMGTVYFVGGERQSFSLHLSGISIGGHLFGTSQKPKAEQAGAGQPAARPDSKSKAGEKPHPDTVGGLLVVGARPRRCYGKTINL